MAIGLNLAENSTYRTRHAAIIVDGKRIISQGINITRTHPLFRKYFAYTETIHAELKAMIGAKVDIGGMTLYSIRNLNGSHANSKPCAHCLALIIESGIRDVVYYEHGEYKKVRL